MSFGSVSFQQYSTNFALGNNGVKICLNYFDGIPDQNLLLSLKSNELRIIFKSLLKKDETTKEKALNELMRIIDSPNLKLCLFQDPIFSLCWSQIYAKLITNESKIIRSLSHEFTTILIKLLNKRVSKFLKDFVPLLLSGVYDTDLSVSKGCLDNISKCFNGDSSKIHSLWTVFSVQILNYIREVVIVESEETLSDKNTSKDNSKIKYNRVIVGTIYMLIHLINANPNIIKESDSIHEILNQKELWDFLSLSAIENIKVYQSLLKLVLCLSKENYFVTNENILKNCIKKLFISMSQINSKNIQKFSLLLPEILSVLIELNHYKEGRIWSYEKSAKSRLLQFLALDSGNADPIIYSKFYQLYEETSLLNYESEWLPLWHKKLIYESERRHTGNFKIMYVEYWKYYAKFIDTVPVSCLDYANKIFQQDILYGLSSKSLKDFKSLSDIFKKFIYLENILTEIDSLLPTGVNEKHKDSIYIDNLISLVICMKDNEIFIKKISKISLDSILQSKNFTNHYGFKIYDEFIKSNILLLKNEIFRFISFLLEVISVSFYNEPLKIMAHYSTSVFIQDADECEWIELYHSLIITILSLDLSPGIIVLLLNQLDSKVIDALFEYSQELKNFIDSYAKVYDFSKPDFMYSKLLSFNILLTLYERSKDINKLKEFFQCINNLPTPLYIEFLESTNFLDQFLMEYPEEIKSTVFSSLLTVIKENNVIAKKAANAILKRILESNQEFSEYIIDYTISIIKANSVTLYEFLPRNTGEKLIHIIPKISSNISLSSPLGTAIYLLDLSNLQFDTKFAEYGIKYGLFIDSLLSKLPEYLDDNLRMFLTILSEVASDYNFVTPNPINEYQNFNNTIFNMENSDFKFKDVLDSIIKRDYSCHVMKILLNTEVPQSLLYYHCRVLLKILMNSIDYISLKNFDQTTTIETYVLNTIRNKNNSDPEVLFCSTLLLSFTKFSAVSTILTKLRTILCSELIGISDSELDTKMFKHIFFLSNLLKVENMDDVKVDFMPISPQRLNLIVKSIDRWLDNGISYNKEFASIRLALLTFLTELIKFPSILTVGHMLPLLCMRLIDNCLDMCQIEDTPFLEDHRIFSLRFYNQIYNMTVSDYFPRDIWNENNSDLENSLIELCFIKTKNETDNQLSYVYYSLLEQNITKLSNKTLNLFYDKFLQSLLFSVHTTGMTRIIVSTLSRLIIMRQQDLLIEYELRRGKFDENLELDLKIPITLIEKVISDMPHEYLEYEDEHRFINYLWYWILILSFFKNISYNLRQLYIEQLKQNDLINKIFNFISEQIDLSDTEFWEQISKDNIVDYNVEKMEFSTDRQDLINECKILLIHLMYELFNNVGSLSSKWWINIRDVSLQSKIRIFVAKYISPILIDYELQDVSGKISGLTSQDQNLAIKINNVTKEVKASYLIDEQKLELSFKLPSIYPLNNIEVYCVSKVGINEQQWKSWLLSIQRVIIGMNGTVIDSLELFAKNVNLHFSGFEECVICYSILHAIDRKLPSKSCPECSNKFHGACLYKWFKSSGNNTCPLCRSEIPFRN